MTVHTETDEHIVIGVATSSEDWLVAMRAAEQAGKPIRVMTGEPHLAAYLNDLRRVAALALGYGWNPWWTIGPPGAPLLLHLGPYPHHEESL